MQLVYRNFDLSIGQGDGSTYPLAVLLSPAGQADGRLRLPFAPVDLPKVVAALDTARLGLPGGDLQAVERFGAQLFDALFQGEVRSVYDVSRQMAAAGGEGLRLRLRIDEPALAAIPWELLYDSRQGDFITLSLYTPVLRYLDMALPEPDLSVTPPLRILGMVANPSNVAALDVAREKARLTEALAVLPSGVAVELLWLEGQTGRSLQQVMQGGPWHVFHYVGHAVAAGIGQEAALLLAGEDGKATPLTATQLARLLADQRTLRLVVLNACGSAGSSQQSLFSSTASVLVRRGIPAVVAMQLEISDLAAVEFTASFYGALTGGLPVDAAVNEARKAISLSTPGSAEWATPVLFMRAPDGAIWQIAQEDKEMSTASKKPWWDTGGIGDISLGDSGGGEVVIGIVGAYAQDTVIGTGNVQLVQQALGEPVADDRQVIDAGLTRLRAALGQLQARGAIDAVTLAQAEVQLPFLQDELVKAASQGKPNSDTILRVAQWVLDRVPALSGELRAFFAEPAVGRALAAAGDELVAWVRERFGDPQVGRHREGRLDSPF